MLLSNLDLLATAPCGVARLRELILTLAVRGKLVPQDRTDEAASVLLLKIREEKDRLIAEGKIKRDEPLAGIVEECNLFALPHSWKWTNLATIGVINPRNEAQDETIASFVQMSAIPVAFSISHSVDSRPWREIKSGFTHFAEGDVGVAKITPCFENGKSTVFKNLNNGIGAGTTELHIVRPLGGISPRYVLLFLKTPAFISNGEAVMTGSAGQKRMPRYYFESAPFPLPPLAEQSRIVTRVEELMRLCDELEARGQLEAKQHAQLVGTLLGSLTASTTLQELAEHWQQIAQHFDLLMDRPQAIDVLEQNLLQLAVRGLLVPQDPQDEPASTLLQRIRTEKDQLVAEGKIKRDKPLLPIADGEKPFELPEGWEWVRFGNASINRDGERIPVSSSDRENRAKIYDYYGASGVIDKIDGFLFDKTLLLIGEDGANLINRSTPVAFLAHGKYWVNNHAHVIDTTHPELMTYLALFINAISLEPYVTGTAQPKMNQAKLNSIVIALPPLAEQSRILSRVTALRHLCTELRQRLAAGQTTQSLLAQSLVESCNAL
ncbi:restriction endonuclease subunit S [Delftia sp. DT-2]|uniref:restriction endonuclease subunit S n=1 Tax=Delftia sp. DT-2 TaxID=3022772 RepID=UPI00233F5A40|nr:restriction endonuclease subunit S [Delftia sp. DT-2]MDC2857368.1 restriction endonuclease subunit S [Delftia sp. DT-2]